MYLDAKDYKGNKINGASKWSGTVGAIYHPTDELSFIGRMTYLGSTSINNGALDVPSFAKYDLGASYKTKLKQYTGNLRPDVLQCSWQGLLECSFW